MTKLPPSSDYTAIRPQPAAQSVSTKCPTRHFRQVGRRSAEPSRSRGTRAWLAEAATSRAEEAVARPHGPSRCRGHGRPALVCGTARRGVLPHQRRMQHRHWRADQQCRPRGEDEARNAGNRQRCNDSGIASPPKLRRIGSNLVHLLPRGCVVDPDKPLAQQQTPSPHRP